MNTKRHILGVLSILLLAAAGYGLWAYGVSDSNVSVASSMFLRIGLVLGAIWLAFPQLSRLFSRTSPWFVALLGFIGLLIIARPRTIVVLGPVMLLLAALHFFGWLLKPPPRRRRRKPDA